MEKQTYTEEELFDKIYSIEESNIKKTLVYDITIEKNSEKKIVEFMQTISEHSMVEYEMDVHQWKVVYNNILLVLDFEYDELSLHYFENEMNPNDIHIILHAFSFLHPKYKDVLEEFTKTKLYLETRREKDRVLSEEMREREEKKRKQIQDAKKDKIKTGWRVFVQEEL